MTTYEAKLDPQIAAGLQHFPPIFPPDAGLLEIRRGVEQLFASLDAPPPNPAVTREDRAIPGPDGAPEVPVRIYRAVQRGEAHAPALLWIHGGGFFLGAAVDNEEFCEQVVLEASAVVVSVEYRLAPEHPFPAAPEDCYAALKWLASSPVELNVDPDRIAVGGVSAGGNLAASVALMARDRGGPALCFQLLLAPVLDDRHLTPSSQEVTDPRVWNRQVSLKAWEAYLAESAREVSAYAAPGRAADLSNLPPAYIYVEGQDLLCDEDIAYANRLMQAGTPTELHVYPGTFHGSYAFVSTAEVSQRAVREMLATLKRVLAAK